MLTALRQRRLILAIMLGVLCDTSNGVIWTEFTVGGATYYLSTLSSNYYEALQSCIDNGWELALFDTNDQYYEVRDYLTTLTPPDLLVYIRFNAIARSTNSTYQFGWRAEPFAEDLWLPKTSYGDQEPDDFCSSVTAEDCCAYFHIYDTYKGLRDTNTPCNEWHNKYLCVENLDECDQGIHDCQQICEDRTVSYACSCESGYELDRDGRSCNDVDECSLNLHSCSHNCTNTPGDYVCSCPAGYTLMADETNCISSDPCGASPCAVHQTCVDNLDSTYSCVCDEGYQANPYDGSLCVDVNECESSTTSCAEHAFCINNDGSFSCTCSSGFTGDGVTTCRDIDECQDLTSKACEQSCTNTLGSFHCSCEKGFQLDSDNTSCVNVNECELGIYNCTQDCKDNPGSYECLCWPGYDFGPDGVSCLDVDECANSSLCQQDCVNHPGSYSCSCMAGFVVMADLHGCADIDECADNPSPCQQRCNNTIGSYVCSCDPGYRLLADLKNCLPEECNCTCQTSPNSDVTMDTIDEKVAKIYAELLLNRKTLSAYIRGLECAWDDRPFSKSIGSMGIIILFTVIGILIVMDVQKFWLTIN